MSRLVLDGRVRVNKDAAVRAKPKFEQRLQAQSSGAFLLKVANQNLDLGPA